MESSDNQTSNMQWSVPEVSMESEHLTKTDVVMETQKDYTDMSMSTSLNNYQKFQVGLRNNYKQFQLLK